MLPDGKTLQLIWDTIWWRRVSYFSTLIITAALALFPALFSHTIDDYSGDPASRLAGLVSGLLPGLVQPWVESFESHPIWISCLTFATATLFLWGALIDRRIHDRALAAWNSQWRISRRQWFENIVRQRNRVVAILVASSFVLCALVYFASDLRWGFDVLLMVSILAGLSLIIAVSTVIYWLILRWIVKTGRHEQGEIRGPALSLGYWLSWALAWPVRFFAQRILPTAFAFALVLLTLVAFSRVAFDFASSGGFVCSPRFFGDSAEGTVKLRTHDVCQPSPVRLFAKVKYRLEITNIKDWKDENGVIVTPEGTSSWSIGWRKLLVELPFRRHLTEQRFVVIARIGEYGAEEYVLRTGTNEITPKRDGRLYLFVNDAVVGLPGLYNYFYGENVGTADIKVTRVGPAAQ
jgi:hypothetical protein